jgi:hypothetical protein
MLGDLNPLGDGPCRSLADNGARAPKILPAAELEGVLGAYFLYWNLKRERRQGRLSRLLELNMLCDCVTRGLLKARRELNM